MKEHRHLGVYGLIIENDNIVLIKKCAGPYTGKLDLPGGSFEFGEKPEETLKRELKEEIGIELINYELFDANSVRITFERNGELFDSHHIGIFYRVTSYKNEIKKEVTITEENNDSLGAEFYEIDTLKKEKLSPIVILELEKIGYNLK